MKSAAWLFVLVALLAAVPFVAGIGTLYFITLIPVWGIFAISFDLVFGLTGLLSFGHAAFFGTGAFAYAFIMLAMPDQFLLALLGAFAAAGVLALVSGALALRLSGIYLSLGNYIHDSRVPF